MPRFEFCPQVRSRLGILFRAAQGMHYYLGRAMNPVARPRSKHTSGARWLRFLMQCVEAQLQNQGLGRADQAGLIVIACVVSRSLSLSLSLSLPLSSRRLAAGILFIRLRRMHGVTVSAAMVGVAGCRTWRLSRGFSVSWRLAFLEAGDGK